MWAKLKCLLIFIFICQKNQMKIRGLSSWMFSQVTQIFALFKWHFQPAEDIPRKPYFLWNSRSCCLWEIKQFFCCSLFCFVFFFPWQVPGWVPSGELRSALCRDLQVCEWREVLPHQWCLSLWARVHRAALWNQALPRGSLWPQVWQKVSLPHAQHLEVGFTPSALLCFLSVEHRNPNVTWKGMFPDFSNTSMQSEAAKDLYFVFSGHNEKENTDPKEPLNFYLQAYLITIFTAVFGLWPMK